MTSNKKIYLDYSATTPIDSEVRNAISQTMERIFGNASSVHSFGREAKVILEESRETIARALNAETGEIFFTSGGTESNNHAIIGTAFAQRRKTGKNHILLSAIEHHAALECGTYLREHGFDVTHLPVDSTGLVSADVVKSKITSRTLLISVMHANNEVGTVQPIKEISSIAKENGTLMHCDAVQTFGKIDVLCNELGIDLLSISAHKIYGPKGIGAIYIRKGVDVDSLIIGGAQERKHRAGTENVPLIAGFAKAVSIAEKTRSRELERTRRLRFRLKELLMSSTEGIIFNGNENFFLPTILSVSLEPNMYEIEAETLLLRLDLNGIAASSGSACTSGSVQPSHVLVAMGKDAKTAKSTIRFSFGRQTSEEDIIMVAEVFHSIVKLFRK